MIKTVQAKHIVLAAVIFLMVVLFLVAGAIWASVDKEVISAPFLTGQPTNKLDNNQNPNLAADKITLLNEKELPAPAKKLKKLVATSSNELEPSQNIFEKIQRLDKEMLDLNKTIENKNGLTNFSAEEKNIQIKNEYSDISLRMENIREHLENNKK